MKPIDKIRNPVNYESRLGEFSTRLFFCDGTDDFQCRYVHADQALGTALTIISTHAAMIGVIDRIIVTDSGDYTVFEWTHERGVTFPPETKIRVSRRRWIEDFLK